MPRPIVDLVGQRFASHATLCAKLEPNAGSWRIFASLCGLCLGQSWLGKGAKVCTCMACWNVCPAGREDFGAVSRMGGDDLDGWLGASWLYLRTLRDVETPPCAECELNSAKPKTAAVEGCADIPCLSHDSLSDTANTLSVTDFGCSHLFLVRDSQSLAFLRQPLGRVPPD